MAANTGPKIEPGDLLYGTPTAVSGVDKATGKRLSTLIAEGALDAHAPHPDEPGRELLDYELGLVLSKDLDAVLSVIWDSMPLARIRMSTKGPVRAAQPPTYTSTHAPHTPPAQGPSRA